MIMRIGSSQEADLWRKSQSGNVEKSNVFQWFSNSNIPEMAFMEGEIAQWFFVKNVLVLEI